MNRNGKSRAINATTFEIKRGVATVCGRVPEEGVTYLFAAADVADEFAAGFAGAAGTELDVDADAGAEDFADDADGGAVAVVSLSVVWALQTFAFGYWLSGCGPCFAAVLVQEKFGSSEL